MPGTRAVALGDGWRRGLASAGAVALLAVSPAMARAQGPPINTQNAFVTGLNGAGLRTFFFGFDRSGLRLDGERVSDPLERQVRVRGQMFVVPYELMPNRLVVMGAVPYLDKTLETAAATGPRELSVRGFGDLVVAAKVGVYQRDRPNLTTRAALYGRLKLPTGNDDAVDAEGEPLPKTLQLGTGSVDYSAGLIVTHSSGPLGLSGDLIHDFNNASEGFAFGDVLHYDIALSYRVLPRVYRTYPAKQINLYLEANGTWSGRNTSAGKALPDSGGSLLLLSPGVQYIPWPSLALEATYQVPVWQDLNGAQLEIDPVFKVGLRWLLF